MASEKTGVLSKPHTEYFREETHRFVKENTKIDRFTECIILLTNICWLYTLFSRLNVCFVIREIGLLSDCNIYSL